MIKEVYFPINKSRLASPHHSDCTHRHRQLRLIKLEKGQKLILFFFDLFPMDDDDDDEDVDLACSETKAIKKEKRKMIVAS